METAAPAMAYIAPPAVVVAAETHQREVEAPKTVTKYLRGFKGVLIATIAETKRNDNTIERETTKYLPDGAIASVKREMIRTIGGTITETSVETSSVYIEDVIEGEQVTHADGTTESTLTTHYRSTYSPHTGSHTVMMRNGKTVESFGRVNDKKIVEATAATVVEKLKQLWLADRDAGRVPNEPERRRDTNLLRR
jgi:hypothetical protein